MLNIYVTLKDTQTDKIIDRELDYSNFSLPGIHIDDRPRQRNELEGWIIDRGNYQHNTKLVLIDWIIAPPKGTAQHDQYDYVSNIKRYLPVDVYRWDLGDCSLNGVTNPDSGLKLVVAHPRGNLTGTDVKEHGYIVLEIQIKQHFTHLPPHISARPACIPEKAHTMMGGNFIYSTDSRFRELSAQPIPVHDRVEG